jgi:hypothetical protein
VTERLQLVNRITEARRTAVAIVGFTDHRAQAPLGNPEWEVWGLNELYRYMPVEKFHRWFELHPRADFERETGGDKPHIEALLKFPIPCYTTELWADAPNVVPLPKENIEAACGTYMTSSIAWMLGLAIAEGFKRIGLYGVDMAQDCVVPDTPVLTADLRWVRAGDLVPGDRVMAYDEEPGIGTGAMAALTSAQQEGGVATAPKVRAVARQWRVATVEQCERLQKPCYRIELADGTILTASDKHRWLTRSEHSHKWRATEDLVTPQHRKGRPTKLVRVLPTWTDEQSHERGYLAAAFDGEGCLGQNGHNHCHGHKLTLDFAQKENAMSVEVRRCLRALGFRWSESVADAVTSFHILGGRAEVLRFLGMVRPRRLLAKFMPDDIGSMQRIAEIAVKSVEFLGEQEVIGLKTSEGTFIADGFASHNSEYAEQRPCVEYLIGLARGKGIEVTVPATSDILKSVAQYGYESQGGEFVRKLVERTAWLQVEHTKWQGQLAELEKQMVARTADLREQYDTQKTTMSKNLSQIEGAIDDCRYWKRSWGLQPTSLVGVPVTPDRGGIAVLTGPPAVEPVAALAAVQSPAGDSPSGA